MADIDPITGLPKSVTKTGSPTADQIRILEAQKADSLRLAEDVQSQGGQVILSKLREKYVNRLNALSKADPECKSIEDFFKSIGVTITMGEIAGERLMRWLKKQTL